MPTARARRRFTRETGPRLDAWQALAAPPAPARSGSSSGNPFRFRRSFPLLVGALTIRLGRREPERSRPSRKRKRMPVRTKYWLELPHPSGNRNHKAGRLPSGDTVACQDWLPAVLSFDPSRKKRALPLRLPIPPSVWLAYPFFLHGKLLTRRSGANRKRHPRTRQCRWARRA